MNAYTSALRSARASAVAGSLTAAPVRQPRTGITIVHIALQGCLRSGAIDYGVTEDTGGHIRYLLELVQALAGEQDVDRQIIVTRRFDDASIGSMYGQPTEHWPDQCQLWRIDGDTTEYLPKEALATEVPAIATNLAARLRAEGVEPALIHAHYADAGAVAALVKRQNNCPFVFTSHSLGAVKREALAASDMLSDAASVLLDKRIATEQAVIHAADLIIASSSDELNSQYGLYEGVDSRNTVINPPGCNLAEFSGADQSEPRIDADFGRFLTDPGKPAIFALARAVRKKNLLGLVHAYGSDPELRQLANLVIVGGNRAQITTLEDEAQSVWRELLAAIDDYDLYGCVAYPKSHRPADVPSMYAWARARRGVFANVAFNEPFGLTLLEAASAGVPVVATNRGGPNDIIARCRNGLLVEPQDPIAIQTALRRLLTDPEHWNACQRSGLEAVSFYEWRRHAQQYVRDVKQRVLAPRQSVQLAPQSAARVLRHTSPHSPQTLLVSDMDGTLTGDVAGIRALAEWLEQHPELMLVIATGRHLDDAVEVHTSWSLPRPAFFITEVGSAIHTPRGPRGWQQIDAWSSELSRHWERSAIAEKLLRCRIIEPQPERCQSACKLSYIVPTGQDVVAHIGGLLRRSGLTARLVQSHDTLLDVLPIGSGKARAARYLATQLGAQSLIAAGDSGNDLDLLRAADAAIIVGNASTDLAELHSARQVLRVTEHHARGVLSGLQRLQQAAGRRDPAESSAASRRRLAGLSRVPAQEAACV